MPDLRGKIGSTRFRDASRNKSFPGHVRFFFDNSFGETDWLSNGKMYCDELDRIVQYSMAQSGALTVVVDLKKHIPSLTM